MAARLKLILLSGPTIAALVAGMALTRIFAANATLTLSTTDTVLVVRAGANAPGVLTLGTAGGATWRSRGPQSLVERAQWEGIWQPLQWKLASTKSDSRSITLVYECASPHLRLNWQWKACAAAGPIEHSIRIENLEKKSVTLPLQHSFAFDWSIPATSELGHMWIDKGAGKPTAVGTHEVSIGDRYDWQGTSSTYAEDGPDAARESIPWMLVESVRNTRPGWYLGVEFSGRTRLTLRRARLSLAGAAGLNPSPGPYLTVVPAGGSFITPPVFLGAFEGGSEAAGRILRRWVREVLLNPVTRDDFSYPLLVENSWGEGMDINEQKARAMIADAASLGLEMYHQDAGWFRGVGDWYASPAKFPHGMAAIADEAHRLGLKFGLWVDWTQAGTDTDSGALNVHDPKTRDWLTRDVPASWKPEDFKGVTIDIGDRAARDWCARELDRLVSEDHLDMLEHDGYLVAKGCDRKDHPHVPCGGSAIGPAPFLQGSCSTDISYHAVESYYELYEGLRRRYPRLLLEACNDGGRMVDFGTAAHTDYFSITDSYDPVSNRRAFYDASHVLPPAMLECYVEKYPAKSAANFLYALRSGMMGWCTIMQDTTAWTTEQHAVARRAFETYKTRLRPLIRDADLYHISPRPDGVHWDALEYFAPDRGHGVVYVFRGSIQNETEHRLWLRGLRSDSEYELRFEDHASANRKAYGHELMSSGFVISLPEPESSELVFIDESRPGTSARR